MASSQIAICNYALGHLGISTEIQDIAERTKEAAACRRFYDQVIEELLRDFPWSFATTFDTLALVATQPNADWLYSYRLPAACVRFRRILSGVRVDSWATRIPYRLARDSQGPVILTDLPDAQGEWTARITDESQFPADFAECAALYLAGLIAPRVTKGDDFKLGDRALKLYQFRRDAAWANQASELAADQDTSNSFLEARGAGEETASYRPSFAAVTPTADPDSDATVA